MMKLCKWCNLIFLLLGLWCCGMTAQAGTIYNSPYVSFSPDGKAWTTDAGNRNVEWYADDGSEDVVTGLRGKLRNLRTGEHYYAVERSGSIPIAKWCVRLSRVNCSHNGYPPENQYHGVYFTREPCLRPHFSGWRPICADCGEYIIICNFYMSKQAVRSIDYLEVGNQIAYYYLCPFNGNLEQGTELPPHKCKDISANRYRVVYNANTKGDAYGGYMSPSFHMYDNATRYEGREVTPQTKLNANTYTRDGWIFKGWNTKPDGSGTYFTDEAEILNLCAGDYLADQGTGTVILYATWLSMESVVQTEQLFVRECDSVYPAESDKTYYVRCDGQTPLVLEYGEYIQGIVRKNFQPDYAIVEMDGINGERIRDTIEVPACEVRDELWELPAERLRFTSDGQGYLIAGDNTMAIRSQRCRRLSVTREYLPLPEMHAQTIALIPIGGLIYNGRILYSQYNKDIENGIWMIGDGEAPKILGLETLEDLPVVDRRQGTLILQVSAEDDLSGVKELEMQIENSDNGCVLDLFPNEEGVIVVDITEDIPIFSGDFTVTVRAADNVGNECNLSFGTTEFDLRAEITRVLEPHDPLFKRGESALLQITSWGYADRVEVEFPAEILVGDNVENQVFVYEQSPMYKQEETYGFMIPLYVPENESYLVTVRAYKGDKMLERYPEFTVFGINGTVLDELRTRLR